MTKFNKITVYVTPPRDRYTIITSTKDQMLMEADEFNALNILNKLNILKVDHWCYAAFSTTF